MNENHKRALDVAADHRGILTRSQARTAGLSDRAIDRCIADGLFVAVSSRVFRVRGAPESEQMAVAAATASAGGRASHSTAARLLRLEAPLTTSPIHVTVDGTQQRPRVTRLAIADSTHAFFAVKVHRYQAVAEPSVTVDRIECTDGARTVIDVAGMLSNENLEAAFERARTLGLVSRAALARRFARLSGRGRAGTPQLRDLLTHAEPNPLESRLEVKAWRLLRSSTLENPARQVRIDVAAGRWYRLDFAWPALRVAFETEGFEWHGSRARWKQDRVRTAALERLGWRIVVATWDDVVCEPTATLDRISIALTAA